MSFTEFVTFIFTMIALIILSIKQKRERYRRDGKEVEEEPTGRPGRLREQLRAMDLTLEDEEEEEQESIAAREEPVRPKVVAKPRQPVEPYRPPTRLLKGDFALKSKVERQKLVTPVQQRRLSSPINQRQIGRPVVSSEMAPEIHADAYAIVSRAQVSKGEALIDRLKSRKEMIILQTIINAPKGLR